jgi:microcystin-dependent protein
MANPFLGEVRVFGCNFAPFDWAFCNGQLLPITQNTALFSLIGTFYGGDGIRTFALPNLQGNIPIGQGQGAGLASYVIGETGGTQTVTLLGTQMPAHNHNLMTDPDDAPANSGSPTGNALCTNNNPATAIYTTAVAPLVQMNAQMIAAAGGNLPHNNLMPYLVLNFCIAVAGIFPPRS